jgi:hypothetical protein
MAHPAKLARREKASSSLFLYLFSKFMTIVYAIPSYLR